MKTGSFRFCRRLTRRAVLIAFALFIFLGSHGTFAQSSHSANSAAWHSQARSIVALPSVAVQSSVSSLSINSSVEQVPFGLSVSQVAKNQNASDSTVSLDGSAGNNGIGRSMIFSASSAFQTSGTLQTAASLQLFSDPSGPSASDFASPDWSADSLHLETPSHLDLFAPNRMPGEYSANVSNAANHFEASSAVAHFVFAKQSRYPVTVSLPVSLEVSDDLYWFGHQYGWISSGVNVRVP